VGTVKKEDESNNGPFWISGCHHVTALSDLARVLKLMNRVLL
jgi:hypothetical protein